MTDANTQLETIWVTDAELIRRSGVPENLMRRTIAGLDADRRSGFPAKQRLWGNRRHWPSVKAYFAKHSGVTMTHQPQQRRQECKGAQLAGRVQSKNEMTDAEKTD